MKTTYVHSFSARPLLIDCYGQDSLRRALAQMWYFALSVAYLRRLGHRIVLHTDSLGALFLGHLPYDEVKLTLDGMPGEIHPRFWAASKFIALSNEEAPCVHIDGDVFIKSERCASLIESALERSDMLVQSPDPARMYELERPLFESEPEFCAAHHCMPDGRDAYNTGILGFRSDEVKSEFVGNYLEIVRYFSDRHAGELDDAMLTPDLIAEQKMAEGFARERGLSTAMLLHDRSEANAIGYQHVFSILKFRELPNCAKTLRIVDPEIYERCRRVSLGFPLEFGFRQGKMRGSGDSQDSSTKNSNENE